MTAIKTELNYLNPVIYLHTKPFFKKKQHSTEVGEDLSWSGEEEELKKKAWKNDELVCSGVSDCNLLVFSENGPLVRPTRILEVPVHLIVMHLLSGWVAHGAGFILTGFLHQLPDAQLLDLHSEDKEKPWVGSSAP